MFSFFATSYFNYFCALLHACSFVTLAAIIIFDDLVDTDGSVTLYIPDPNDRVGNKLVPWRSPSIFFLLALFSGITAMAHAWYGINANTHDSSIRFVEYFVTASTMGVVIAILVGIKDVYAIIGIETCIATTMIFGYVEEKTLKSQELAIRPYYMGYIPYLGAWFTISWQFIRVALENDELPSFVIAVFVTQFLLFTCFGIVQWYYVVRDGAITNNMEMEGAYNFLSIISKQLLVWLCVGGIIGQQQN